MKIVIIGCGVMGGAFARHFSAYGHMVILVDKDQARSVMMAKELGAEVYARSFDAVKKGEIVLIAVKPKDLLAVAEETAKAFTQDQLLISILAGVSTEILRQQFSLSQVLRIMPNLAITCGEGVIGLVESIDLEEKWKKRAVQLFEGMGLQAWLPEEKVDALTALTGSGPAFLIVMIEAIIESGIYLGLGADEARDYALQMIEGTVALLKASNERHPGNFRWQIASPAGTTIAGIKMMEERAVRGAIIDTFAEAYRRAAQGMLK